MAQKVDSAYVKEFPQRMWVTGYAGISSIVITDQDKMFFPNYPVNGGVGIGIRNTLINLSLGHSIVPLKSTAEFGKTKITDFQIHNYGRHLLIDLYYQKYRGFFTEDKDVVTKYPDLFVQQIGAGATYILHGNKFSAKAAFEQNEQQIKSSGSVLFGAEAYWQRFRPESEPSVSDNNPCSENLQLGISGGYGYSWVANKYWLMTGMVTGGFNIADKLSPMTSKGIRIYPAVLFRASTTYHVKDWSLSCSVLINNTPVYSVSRDLVNLTSLNMRIAFVKQLDNIFKWKGKR